MTVTIATAKYVLGQLLNELGPDDVTDEEAATMAAILQKAWDCKHEGVINLDLVRRHPRSRR